MKKKRIALGIVIILFIITNHFIWAGLSQTRYMLNYSTPFRINLGDTAVLMPVIASLEKYHTEHGLYPDRLDQLDPTYPIPSASINKMRWRYSVDERGESYTIVITDHANKTFYPCFIYNSSDRKWTSDF